MEISNEQHQKACRAWLADHRALSNGTGPGDAARAVRVDRLLPKGAPGLLRRVLVSGRSTWQIASRQKQREFEVRNSLARALDALAAAYGDCAPGAAQPLEHEHRIEAPQPGRRVAA